MSIFDQNTFGFCRKIGHNKHGNSNNTAMKYLMKLCFFICMWSVCQANTLYEASVKIPDKSSQHWKTDVSLAACETLKKVSGKSNICAIIDVEQELTDIEEKITQYQYQNTQEGLILLIKFDPGFIDNTLLKYDQPIWSSLRPKTLLWLNFNDLKQVKALERDVRNAAKNRGLDFITPIYDIKDTQNIPKERALEVIKERAKRYAIENLLVGIEKNDHIEWHLLYNKSHIRWQTNNDNLKVSVMNLISHTADYYANEQAHYAQDSAHDSIFIEISNIYGYDEYQKLISKLEKITDIEAMDVSEFQDHYILLHVTIKYGLDSLTESIQKLRQFSLNTGSSHFNRSNISYQWVSELKEG